MRRINGKSDRCGPLRRLNSLEAFAISSDFAAL